MSKRCFIIRKNAFILIGTLAFFISHHSLGQDTSKNVLKIRKKYSQGDYFPRINGKVMGAIKRSELFDPRGLYTVAPLKITSFELHSFDREKEIVFTSNSCYLTPPMRAHIKKLSPGAILYFRNITAFDEKDKKYLLNGIRYVIEKE